MIRGRRVLSDDYNGHGYETEILSIETNLEDESPIDSPKET